MRFSKLIFHGLSLCSFATLAQAETFCASHAKLEAILDSKFGEQQQGYGLAGKEAMVELYVSAKGTFTLVSTNTQGLSCIVGAGDSWEKLQPKPDQHAASD